MLSGQKQLAQSQGRAGIASGQGLAAHTCFTQNRVRPHRGAAPCRPVVCQAADTVEKAQQSEDGADTSLQSMDHISQELNETASKILTDAPTSLEATELTFRPRSSGQKALTSFKLLFALPWRRFKKGSVLYLKLGGGITEKKQGGLFSEANSMPQIIEAITKAAHDPRVSGIYIKLSRLDIGWAKAQELARYLRFFKQSGKFVVSFMEGGGEKEYYLASAGGEVFVPPSAQFALKGFSVQGQFLRGVLDKIGIEPQVQRIGRFKSAGDQLLRKDMSEDQREQLTALLDSVYGNFVESTAKSWNKSQQEVEDMLNAGFFDMKDYAEGGWVTGLKYESEVIDDLKQRTHKDSEKPLKTVKLDRYAKVRPTTFGLVGRKRIAVIRAAGTIVGGESRTGGNISSEEVISQLRKVRRDKKVEAVVLRVDSPGGDALASDLMWHEIRRCAEKKPVIASMADVAASGGYYMAMGCHAIVAEPLTITGSIGVVAAKFNLAEVYGKAGFNKQVISRGRYAEILGENRGFTDDELNLFERSARNAYEDFRNKAASSRGLSQEHLESVAQGRVWAGQAALQQKLIDAIGGISQAVALAKKAAGIGADETVRLVEMSREQTSPINALLSNATSLSALAPLLQMLLLQRGMGTGLPLQSSWALTDDVSQTTALTQALLEAARLQQSASPLSMLQAHPGRPIAYLGDIKVEGAGNL